MPTKLHPKGCTHGKVMTSYWVFKMAAIELEIYHRLLSLWQHSFSNVQMYLHPNFDKIAQSSWIAVSLLLLIWENGQNSSIQLNNCVFTTSDLRKRTYLNYTSGQRRRKQIESGWAQIPARSAGTFFSVPLHFFAVPTQFGGHCTHQSGHKDGQS